MSWKFLRQRNIFLKLDTAAFEICFTSNTGAYASQARAMHCAFDYGCSSEERAAQHAYLV